MDLAELARTLPDVPRWIETRSMLLSGRGEVYGAGSARAFAVLDRKDGLVCVVGRPGEEIVRAAARNQGVRAVISAPEDRDHVRGALPGWEPVRAVLHLPGKDGLRLPPVPEGSARFLYAPEVGSLKGLTGDLREELEVALRRSSVAAAICEGRPVSFCYAAARTEGLWDISIDTLEGFRGRGLAARCVSHMAGEMEWEGLRPVWGAEETNPASLGLAGKLGFVPVDEVAVFHPPRDESSDRAREAYPRIPAAESPGADITDEASESPLL